MFDMLVEGMEILKEFQSLNASIWNLRTLYYETSAESGVT